MDRQFSNEKGFESFKTLESLFKLYQLLFESDRVDHFSYGLIESNEYRPGNDVVADVEFGYFGDRREGSDISGGQAVARGDDVFGVAWKLLAKNTAKHQQIRRA